jgi:hypothetical protein
MLSLEPVLDLARTEHLAHMHRVRKALQGVPPELAVIEERTNQAVCDRGNDEGIGLGNTLQARDQVRGLADCGVLLGTASRTRSPTTTTREREIPLPLQPGPVCEW